MSGTSRIAALLICVSLFVVSHHVWGDDGKNEEEVSVLDEEDAPCKKHNPHLQSLVEFAESLRKPEFIKTQKWAELLLALNPDGDGVLKKIEAFSLVTIKYFDLEYAIIFCRTAHSGRYSTQVAALLSVAWRNGKWEYLDGKLVHAYGKDHGIELEDAEFHKWWKDDGPTNGSRVGRTFILKMSEGGAAAFSYATTYRLAKNGKFEVVPFPTVTKKIVSEKADE